MVAKLTLVGNLGVDPEVRYTPDGRPVVTCRVASNYRKRDPESHEWVDATNWYRVTTFGRLAERLSEQMSAGRLSKGSRIIVFDRVYDEFRDAMLTRVNAGKVGSSPDDDCGPVISQQALDRLLAAVGGAVQRGGRILTGGKRIDALAPGYYMAPTVLDNVAHDDELSQQELFGPVTCLYRVSGFDEAVKLANATTYGLTGAIHTSNPHRIEEFVATYRGGLVSINGPTYGAGPHMPFGGVKNSGNGFREPGTEAVDVYSEWKTIVFNHNPARV